MTIAAIFIGAVIIAGIVWSAIFGGRAPGAYFERSCQGREWRRRFPDAPKAEIREFLVLFANSFAFREREKLKFAPDDELFHIYRTIYPVKDWPDALEFETLAKCVADRYGVELANVWKDNLTLGQLFQVTRQR